MNFLRGSLTKVRDSAASEMKRRRRTTTGQPGADPQGGTCELSRGTEPRGGARKLNPGTEPRGGALGLLRLDELVQIVLAAAVTQLSERLEFDLADAFSGEAEVPTDLL